MAAGEAATAFVATSLDTGLAVSFPASSTTVADLKRIVSDEHTASFPHIGRITVECFEVRRRGSWYRLADSMAVRAAFHGVKGAWHLQAHALPLPAPPSSSDADMLHRVLCSQHNAIASQGALSDAPSADRQEDAHRHIGGASALAPPVKRSRVEGDGCALRGENSDADAADEGGYSPLRGQPRADVIEDPRGRENFREGDGDHDQSLLVDCDDQNKCRDNPMSKRICVREDEFLNEVDADSVGTGGDVHVRSSDDEMLEGEGALDNSCWHDEGLGFVKKKEEEAVSTRPANHEVESSVQLCTHETMPITEDKESQLCFSVNKNVSTTATEEHADGLAQGKLVEQQDHLDNGTEVLQGNDSKDTATINSEYVSESHQHEGSSRSFALKCCKGSKCEILTDQVGDHTCVCSETEVNPIEMESQENHDGLIKRHGTVSATVFGPSTPNLELSEEKVNSAEKDYHRIDSLLHDLDDCAHSLRENPICGQKEPWVAEVYNSASSKKGSDLPPCAEATEEGNSSEKEAMAHKAKGKELWTDKVCNGERSSKGTDRPPRAKSTKEDNPSEKEATTQEVEENEPWTGRMCNGERSSSKGTDHPPRAESTKEDNPSEKEGTTHEVEENEPWTGRMCNGERSSSKGTDHPPCAESMRGGNSSEKEGVAHEEKQSTRTVTFVDMDGTEWKMQLDDNEFELGSQESSSFSWSKEENRSSDAEEIQSHQAKPRQNAEERPEGAPDNGGTRVPTKRSDLPRHGSIKTPASSGPTGSKHAGATSADGAEQGSWDKRRRQRHVVRKMPKSRAEKMYGNR